MRQGFLAVLILTVSAACFAQGNKPYTSLGGFGNVLYPGVGHAPNAPVPFGVRGGGGFPTHAAPVGHAPHGRNSIVPYPVIVGGYYPYGYYGNGYGDPSQQQYQQDAAPPISSNGPPSVVINQTFIPDHAVPMVTEYGGDQASAPQEQPSGMHLYEGLKTQPYIAPAAKKADDLPTLYLIAFKDNTIVQALGYWVENGALHYVSAEHTLNQASLDLINRDLTQRLNDERNVEFKLPKN